MPMTSFLEERFPVDISYGSSGGPKYSTTLIQTESGVERRIGHWEEPLREYDASTGIQSLEGEENQINGISKLHHFFNVCMGRLIPFRYKDWGDYTSAQNLVDENTLSTDQLLGVGNGTQTQFQLRRAYIAGNTARWRTIKKPVEETVTVSINSVQQMSGWTCDYTTGIITFLSPVETGLEVRAGFQYDVPCRFNDDVLALRLDQYMAGSASIPIVEIRL